MTDYTKDLEDIEKQTRLKYKGERVKDLKNRYSDMGREIGGRGYALIEAGKVYLGMATSKRATLRESFFEDRESTDEALATAYHLMELKDNPKAFMMGAELYAALGKEQKAKRKLRKLRGASKGVLTPKNYQEIQSFIERNTEGERQQQSGSGLEGRFVVFILMTIAGIVIGANSLTATGNVISRLVTPPGLIGMSLFVVGLIGLFLSSKRKT